MDWQPRNPEFRSFVERYVAAQGFLALIGTELARVDPGRAEYRVPFRADLGQQDGFFHGGVIGSVAEGVMGAAAATMAPAGTNVVGASYTVNLLSPAIGEVLVARGQVVKPGRRLIICRADVFVRDAAADERLSAIGQGAMAVVDAQ